MRCRRRSPSKRASSRSLEEAVARSAPEFVLALRKTLRAFEQDAFCVHEPRVTAASEKAGKNSGLPINTLYVRITERSINKELGFLAFTPAGKVSFVLFVLDGIAHSVFEIAPAQQVRSSLEMELVLKSALRRTPFQAIVGMLVVAGTYKLTEYHQGFDDPEYWQLVIPRE